MRPCSAHLAAWPWAHVERRSGPWVSPGRGISTTVFPSGKYQDTTIKCNLAPGPSKQATPCVQLPSRLSCGLLKICFPPASVSEPGCRDAHRHCRRLTPSLMTATGTLGPRRGRCLGAPDGKLVDSGSELTPRPCGLPSLSVPLTFTVSLSAPAPC